MTDKQPEAKCWCTTCRPITMDDMRFVVCPNCGDKRCVHASNHEAPCAKADIYAHNSFVERMGFSQHAALAKKDAAIKELREALQGILNARAIGMDVQPLLDAYAAADAALANTDSRCETPNVRAEPPP